MKFYCFIFLTLGAPKATSAGKLEFVRDEIEIKDCGSEATIESITFDGCSEFPCIVTSGDTAQGQVTITSNSVTSSLTCELIGVIGTLELPFNGCDLNACDNLDEGDCPTKAG